MGKGSCEIPDCELPVKARGWCNPHYQSWRRLGDPLAAKARSRVVAVAGPCLVDECPAPVLARNLCCKHYTRLRRRGSTQPRLRGEVVDGHRLCPKCGDDVPVDQWHTMKRGQKRVYTWCKSCWNVENRRRQSERRAMKLGVPHESFGTPEILERDDYTCGICRAQIDPGIKWPDPMSPSLDHVIPLARGGSHLRVNVQAAHLGCNQKKWASVPSIRIAAVSPPGQST